MLPDQRQTRKNMRDTTSTLSSDFEMQRGATLSDRRTFSPEMRLLFCCGGPFIQASHSQRMGRLIRGGIDWDLAMTIAQWHGMQPLLYWNVVRQENQRDGSRIPPSVLQSMRDMYVRNVGVSLGMLGDFFEILSSMNDLGIPVVPYKGPILASRLYGHLGLRVSSDLDILVRKSDLPKAREVLINMGYELPIILRSNTHAFQVASRYSERFERSGSVVELHWAFTNKDVAFPVVLDHLIPRLVDHEISGRPVPVLSPDDALIVLCVHGAKHGWGRLEWICGVAELSHDKTLDWQVVCARASETQSLRRLLVGLCLAHDVYDVPLPDSVRKRILGDKHTLVLASEVRASLVDVDHPAVSELHTFGTLEHDIFNFKLGDSVAAKVRYFTYRLTTPSRPEKWSTITLGAHSVTLHSFIRPFGVVAKLLPAIFRRLIEARRVSASSGTEMRKGSGYEVMPGSLSRCADTIQIGIRNLLKRVTSNNTRRKLAFAYVMIRRPTAKWRPLPTVLVIGAQRCGTSSLFKYLGSHPQCLPSARKEVRYFTEFYDRDVDWYRSHFPITSREKAKHLISFEVTPDYLLDPRAPGRASGLLPNARIIVLLRDPIKRAHSQYLHNRRLGNEPLSFSEALAREEERIGPSLEMLEHSEEATPKALLRYSYVERGRYTSQLARWLEYVGTDRTLIVQSESLFKNTDATFQRILDFLELPAWQLKLYENFSYVDTPPEASPIPPDCIDGLQQVFESEIHLLADLFAQDSGPVATGYSLERVLSGTP